MFPEMDGMTVLATAYATPERRGMKDLINELEQGRMEIE